MRFSRAIPLVAVVAALVCLAIGCKSKPKEPASKDGIFGLENGTPAADRTADSDDPATVPHDGGPLIGAVEMVAPIYEKSDRRSPVIGYVRAGGTIVRGEKPVRTDDCEGGYYRVLPVGFMCATKEATLDMQHPILRALTLRPDISKAEPYPYAFVRAIAPNYYRVPTKEEQFQYEMALDKHLRSYNHLHEKWDALSVGSNDIALDAKGNAVGPIPADPPPLDYNKVYGGNGSDDVPWFFKDGRKIPNIADFKVPHYAVMTNRVPRKAMLALVGTFVGPNDRRFAITTDARLVPTSKLKPDRGSIFHGVDLENGWHLPVAWVKLDDVSSYEFEKGTAKKKDSVDRHTAIQLTGESKYEGGQRYVEAQGGTWYKEHDVAIAAKPSKLPAWAKDPKKRWIDISIQSQTLVLYEGGKAVYATAVSTGRDGLGDPKTTRSTPTGTFHIREKHITTTMDAHEVENKFELRDVPWVEYFKAGYALHAAPWHDDFGKPRSHGCVNMAPIDARRVFMFTDPPLPSGWHGVDADAVTGEGTLISIHP
jgi:lipoprotein-anchoring transpeptidase ErfK/SrfK